MTFKELHGTFPQKKKTLKLYTTSIHTDPFTHFRDIYRDEDHFYFYHRSSEDCDCDHKLSTDCDIAVFETLGVKSGKDGWRNGTLTFYCISHALETDGKPHEPAFVLNRSAY